MAALEVLHRGVGKEMLARIWIGTGMGLPVQWPARGAQETSPPAQILAEVASDRRPQPTRPLKHMSTLCRAGKECQQGYKQLRFICHITGALTVMAVSPSPWMSFLNQSQATVDDLNHIIQSTGIYLFTHSIEYELYITHAWNVQLCAIVRCQFYYIVCVSRKFTSQKD